MTNEWHTVSARVNQEERRALELLCEREGIKRNHLLRSLVQKEIEPLLKPGTVPLGKGIPTIGEHRFKYNPEKDTFTWQLDQGAEGTAILAEEVKPKFLKELQKAITEAIDEEEKTNGEIRGSKARVPKKLLQYKRR